MIWSYVILKNCRLGWHVLEEWRQKHTYSTVQMRCQKSYTVTILIKRIKMRGFTVIPQKNHFNNEISPVLLAVVSWVDGVSPIAIPVVFASGREVSDDSVFSVWSVSWVWLVSSYSSWLRVALVCVQGTGVDTDVSLKASDVEVSFSSAPALWWRVETNVKWQLCRTLYNS